VTVLGRTGRLVMAGVAVLLFLLIGGLALAELYIEALWFGGLGYGSVFWSRLGIQAGVRGVVAVVGAVLVLVNLWVVARQIGPVQLRRRYGNLEIAEQIPPRYVSVGIVAVAVLAGIWLSGLQFGAEGAVQTAAWARRAQWGVADPLFGRDLSFYLFTLPLSFRIVHFLLIVAVWSLALSALGYLLVGSVRWRESRLEVEEGPRLHFVTLGATVVVLLGIRYWLGRYGLLMDGNGFQGSLGYTDVHARLPAYRIMAVLSILAGAALLYAAWKRSWVPAAAALTSLAAAALLVGQLYPAFVQRFRVEPNQFAREARYIAWNLEFTKRAYGLDRIDRRQLPYRRAALPPWEQLGPTLARLPLWDPEPLQTTYNERQALFGYYHFPDVDFDRYGPPGAAEQVAIGVREFNLQGLPEATRTWQTLRLDPTYVRGLGTVVSPVARTTLQGEPVFWLQNLNPIERHPGARPELNLQETAVYIGESMADYVILIPGRDNAITGEPGLDFPAGIAISSPMRRLALAWRFGDLNLLVSGEITQESRFLYRRTVAERVEALAPFLLWDDDPYPVLHGGRVVWILDGYTAATRFPLARGVQLPGAGRVRYLRSSVKATVDAVTGDVALYQVEEEDPILETYRRLFPELIRARAEMPAELRRHLRYPARLLRTQAEILEQYHVEQPRIFYSGEALWQMALVPGRQGMRPYRPSYMISRLPGGGEEFLLIQPFIARQRQNMTSLLAARSDPPHYGELVLLELPRDQLIPGPAQVDALIEQDPLISAQLTLWRQGGRNVELGHLRIVPVEHSFLYVQPLFISSQGSPLPELQRVLVSDGSAVSMASTLEEAVRGLITGMPATPAPGQPPLPGREAGDAATPQDAAWAARATELMERAEERLRSGDWTGFGAAWTELRNHLSRAGASPPPTP
jgi:uncharacterized protein